MSVDTHSTPAVWYLDAAPGSVSAWVVRLQWTRSAVDALVLIGALLISGDDFPLRRLAPFVAAAALVRADLALRLRRGQQIPPLVGGAAIAIDAVLLTGLLELSGGPSNPFAVIYAVQVLLAGATLGAIWAAVLALWTAACYGVLISWHLGELAMSHHRLIDLPTHLFTMWLALAITADLAAHFIREASAAVARREAQLTAMRTQAGRRERLTSLTTLAAGAAHELSTPLGTVAVAGRELERALVAAGADPSWTSDARLIRQQVARCHGILDQMSGRAGGGTADIAEPTDIAVLVADLKQRLPPDQAARMQVRIAPSLKPILVPRAGLVQVLLSLVKNAFDASDSHQPVMLEGVQHDRLIRLVVRDQGTRMTDDVLRRAGEPFYTTKEPGRGFGLGLFLARMFAQRCGGTLTLHSDRGTIAVLELPLSSESPGVA
ncbi:MAG: sensor histidine kinase [Luteitalea sp.]|nr:sensor histidine kinase [Luteitalea sp.]